MGTTKVSVGLEYSALVNLEVEVPDGEDPSKFLSSLIRGAGCDLGVLRESPHVTRVDGLFCNCAAIGGTRGTFPAEARDCIPTAMADAALEVGMMVSEAINQPGVEEGVDRANAILAAATSEGGDSAVLH